MSQDTSSLSDGADPGARNTTAGGHPPPYPAEADTLTPLAGEAGIPSVARQRRAWVSWGRLGTLGAVLFLVASAAALWLQRSAPGSREVTKQPSEQGANRPSAALAEPRRLDLQSAPQVKPASSPAPVIPALVPGPQDLESDPIGLRQPGTPPNSTQRRNSLRPEDAPVLLVSSRPSAADRAPELGKTEDEPKAGSLSVATPSNPLQVAQRNLQTYQRQLDGMLTHLTRATSAVQAKGDVVPPTMPLPGTGSNGEMSGSGAGANPGRHFPSTSPNGPAGAGLFGGQLQASATPRVQAGRLGNRSLTLPKGTAFNCALKTKVISATAGLVGCQVQRNVYSDDGRVLLIERGSHVDGEYRVTSVRPGMVRIPVLWTRIRTPLGVTVDVDSPGTGQLGESGIDGHVDNRWSERIGAAMLLSLIDDTVQLVVQNQSADPDRTTIVLPSTTDSTSKLAEKVLDSTINIPPLIYQNQGGIVGIYVARDVDFSSVYELKPTVNTPLREGKP